MQTKAMKTYSIALSLAGFLSGCTNALYFYETEKISLTAEVRPDSSQPVQGSLGIKQRVVLIAPKKSDNPKNNGNSDTPNNYDNCPTPKNNDNSDKPKKLDIDDAVSAISSFSFNIIPEAGAILNPVLIQTAFITGEAAACLNEIQAQNAAQAIAIDGVQSPGADISIMRNVVHSLDQNNKEDNKHLSLLSGLGKAVIPTNYPVPIFVLDPTTNNLTIGTHRDSPVSYSDIDSALTYEGELNGSAGKLQKVLNNPNISKFEGIPVTNEMVNNGLRNDYENTNKELKRIRQELTGNSIYTDAVQYYIDKYIKKTVGD